jgi:hypothetical protein
MNKHQYPIHPKEFVVLHDGHPCSYAGFRDGAKGIYPPQSLLPALTAKVTFARRCDATLAMKRTARLHRQICQMSPDWKYARADLGNLARYQIVPVFWPDQLVDYVNRWPVRVKKRQKRKARK